MNTLIDSIHHRHHSQSLRSGEATPSMASQPSRHIPVPSFGRFDEITYLVENAAALTQSVTKWASL